MIRPPGCVVPIYKPIGKTPLQCVEEFKQLYPQYKDETVSYAGRLDPMAEGVLLFLVGDTNKKRREYEHLDKEYEVSVLCGIGTDTGDLLGRITQFQISNVKIQKEQVSNILQDSVGSFRQRYPAYSSAKVNGKPLYWWARKGRLHEIIIPTHKVTIHAIEYLSTSSTTAQHLLERVQTIVPYVQGDFRQEDIVQAWQDNLKHYPNSQFPLVYIKVSCGSGVFMRVLAEDVGSALGLPACAFSIKRTRVGEFTLSDIS